MAELYNKEDAMYRNELRLKKKEGTIITNSPVKENKEINREERKTNQAEYWPQNISSEANRFDKRRVHSTKKQDKQENFFDQELLTNFKHYNNNLDNFYENSHHLLNKNQEFSMNYIRKTFIQLKENSEKEINERLRIDEEIRNHHKHLELLKQEEIIKKKRYQDSLLSQINDKIQRQLQMLNSKYSSGPNNPEFNENI